MNIAFIDRDGTIIRDYPDEEWKHIVEPEFLDGSIKALKAIRSHGYQIIIITNQYLINDGIITMEQYETFTTKMVRELKLNEIDLLDIFFCPHSLNEHCDCYKPKTGLIDQAVKKYVSIDLNQSFIIGDSAADIELGNKIGIKTFGIKLQRVDLKYIRVDSLHDVINYL